MACYTIMYYSLSYFFGYETWVINTPIMSALEVAHLGLTVELTEIKPIRYRYPNSYYVLREMSL